jgi:hypothetical protein
LATYYSFAGVNLGAQSFENPDSPPSPIDSVSSIGYLIYFVSSQASEVISCRIDDFTVNPFKVPCIWTLNT